MAIDCFESQPRRLGDLSGVFECDDEAAYFYLFAIDSDEGGRSGTIIDHICVATAPIDFDQASVSIRWDAREEKVALLFGQKIRAVFDTTTGKKYKSAAGSVGTSEVLPCEAIEGFSE